MWKTLLILAAVLYFLLPYDFLPDTIFGWGWLDDLVVLIIIWQIFVRIKQKQGVFQSGGSHRDFGSDRAGPDDAHASSAHRDSYEVLGVSRRATPEEIKHAYRHLAGQYHPDKVSHLGEEFKVLAEKRFKEIQEAYQELTRKKGR